MKSETRTAKERQNDTFMVRDCKFRAVAFRRFVYAAWLREEVPTCTGSSSTPLQMGQSRSSSTSPWNLVTSYPMAHYWSSLIPVMTTEKPRWGGGTNKALYSGMQTLSSFLGVSNKRVGDPRAIRGNETE